MGVSVITKVCNKCGSNLHPLTFGNGRKGYLCQICRSISYDDEIQIEPLKKMLMELATSGRQDANFPIELEEQSKGILAKESDCLYAKFFYRYSLRLRNNYESYREFLKNEVYEYDKDDYTKNIVETISGDNLVKYRDLIIEHLRKVVTDKTECEKYISRFEFNCAKVKETVVTDFDVYLYCAECDYLDSKTLIEHLSSRGIQVWNLYNNTQSILQDRQNIANKALTTAKSFVFVTTENGCATDEEDMISAIRLARNNNIPIFEYKFKGVRLNDNFGRVLPEYQTAYANGSFLSGASELVDMLQKKLNPKLESNDLYTPVERGKTQDFAVRTTVMPAGIEPLSNIIRCIAQNEFDQAKYIFFSVSKGNNFLEYYMSSLVYNLWGAFKADKNSRMMMMGEAQAMYTRLKAFGGGTMTPEEEEIYEYLDEPNQRGLLMVTYAMLNDSMRYRYLGNKVDIAYITSTLVTNQLIKILIMVRDFQNLNYILETNKNLDFLYAMKTIQAANNISEADRLKVMDIFASKAKFKNPQGLKEQFNAAMEQAGSDDERSVYFEMMYRNGIEIDYENLNAFTNVSDGLVAMVCNSIAGASLDGGNLDSIITFALKSKNADAIVNILDILKTGANISDPGDINVSRIVSTDLPDPLDRLRVLRQLMEFDLRESTIQGVVKDYLEKSGDSPESRLNYIKTIVEYCANSNPVKYIFIKTYENYLITNVRDEAYKVLIFNELSKVLPEFDNASFVVDKYSAYTKDSVVVKQKIISKFADMNTDVSVDIASQYLDMPIEEYSTGYKNMMKQYLVKKPSAASKELSKYLKSDIKDENYEILESISGSLSAVTQSELKEIILCQDEEKRNRILIKALPKVSELKRMNDEFSLSLSVVECNMLQGLLAISKEDTTELSEVVRLMKSAGCETDEKVVYMGKRMKWNEFPVSAGLCESTRNICLKY